MRRATKFLLPGLLLAALIVTGLCLARAFSSAPKEAKNQPPPFATVTDALAREITLRARPERIVSLAPSATEILFAIGAGERVIADTNFCNYPPAAAKLPKIGGYLEANVEQLIALKPDLVVAARGNRSEILERLQALDIPVLATESDSFDGVKKTIRLIGHAVGEKERAEELIADMEHRKQNVLQRVNGLTEDKRPRVLFLFTPKGLSTAGPGSHIDELLRLAGGKNIAAECGNAWPEISLETAIAKDPEVILVLEGHGADVLTKDRALAFFRADPRWKDVSAVQHGRVSVLPDDPVTIPGPRLITALEALCAALYPEPEERGR